MSMDSPCEPCLNFEQLAELKQAFTMCDLDGDNYISSRELGLAMRAMGLNPTEAEILQLVNTVCNLHFALIMQILGEINRENYY